MNGYTVAIVGLLAFTQAVLLCVVAVLGFLLHKAHATTGEILDKFVHNRVPERLVERNTDTPNLVVSEGMGDPLSIAERHAEQESLRDQS